jgi:hypothetical protein
MGRLQYLPLGCGGGGFQASLPVSVRAGGYAAKYHQTISNTDLTQSIESFFSKSINQPTNAPLSIQNREVLLQLRQGIPVESQLVYDVLEKSKRLILNIY